MTIDLNGLDSSFFNLSLLNIAKTFNFFLDLSKHDRTLLLSGSSACELFLKTFFSTLHITTIKKIDEKWWPLWSDRQTEFYIHTLCVKWNCSKFLVCELVNSDYSRCHVFNFTSFRYKEYSIQTLNKRLPYIFERYTIKYIKMYNFTNNFLWCSSYLCL